MATIRVGLASQSGSVDADALRKVAAALDVQVKQHLRLVWDIDAAVSAVEDPLRIPRGMWPIIVLDHTPSSVGGLHTTDHGIPFAVVLSSRNWGLAASHECIEMLIDPTGNKTVRSIGLEVVDGEVRETAQPVDYLLEACDPIEDEDHAYDIDGVAVTDFYTPNYFDDRFVAGRQYSFNGALTRPREVRPNGYLSWRHPVLNRLQQLRAFGTPSIVTLPEHDAAGVQAGNSVREFVDRHTDTPRLKPQARSPVGPSQT